jgi:hypothetical protein
VRRLAAASLLCHELDRQLAKVAHGCLATKRSRRSPGTRTDVLTTDERVTRIQQGVRGERSPGDMRWSLQHASQRDAALSAGDRLPPPLLRPAVYRRRMAKQ